MDYEGKRIANSASLVSGAVHAFLLFFGVGYVQTYYKVWVCWSNSLCQSDFWDYLAFTTGSLVFVYAPKLQSKAGGNEGSTSQSGYLSDFRVVYGGIYRFSTESTDWKKLHCQVKCPKKRQRVRKALEQCLMIQILDRSGAFRWNRWSVDSPWNMSTDSGDDLSIFPAY
jgi:hypothetical protein